MADRSLPRPFSFPHGQGMVVDEVSVESRWHVPTIQLLEWEEGDVSLRFCSYTHAGRFQRNPLVVSTDDLASLGDVARSHDRLATLLQQMTRG